MVTLASFTEQFPEFGNTASANEAYVRAVLDAADLEIDREVWGAKADQGQMYLAAHKLSLSPFGNNAELVKDGVTTYGKHFDALRRQVVSGFRVA